MTNREARQSLGWVALGTLMLLIVVLSSALLATNAGDALIRNTIRLSLAWYVVALWLMIRGHKADKFAMNVRARRVRWCWTWACICFWVHVAVAFHYVHGWSHDHAFERTRQVSGVGGGIYVSYLFALWWAFDVAQWWLWPVAYARRPAWLERGWHAFMLFMVFNGTIVYEAGPIRWCAAAGFLILSVAWLKRLGQPVEPGNAVSASLREQPA